MNENRKTAIGLVWVAFLHLKNRKVKAQSQEFHDKVMDRIRNLDLQPIRIDARAAAQNFLEASRKSTEEAIKNIHKEKK